MESESSGVPEPNPTPSQPPEPTVTRIATVASPITKVFTPQTGAAVLKQMDAMLPQRKLTVIPASQARPLLSSNNLPPGTKTVLVRTITPGSPGTAAMPKAPPGSRFILVQPRTQNGIRPAGTLIRVPSSTNLTAVTPKSFYATQKAASPAASSVRPATVSVPPRTATPTTVRVVAAARTPAPARSPAPVRAPAPAPQPAAPKNWGYRKNKDMQDVARLSPDLQEAYMILLDILADKNNNWPFMNQVDPVLDGAPDYNHVVTSPMWLTKIKEKFLNNQYTKIIEPMNDLRLMFENCYRYNGPAHPVTKRALKLEHLMELKIARLAPNLKEECAIAKFMETRPAVVETEAESDVRRSKRTGAGDYFSPILYRVRDERDKREEEIKLKIAEARRLQKEEHERRVKEWEEQLLSESAKRHIKAMWEIPQIAHFLALAQNVLNIDEIPLFEFELMFAMPQASLLLTTLMTNLLSSPIARLNMDKSQPKDYDFWHRKLSKRMAEWYRCYRKERFDSIKVLDVLGIEPPFWDIVGITNPLDQKQFHELTLHQRVWIFKTVCDIILHTDKGVQEVLSEETGLDSMEVYLGSDRHDFHYFHLPAIAGDDVRVYRQKGFDVKKDPYWGPICDEREQEELERQRIEEEERLKKEAEEEAKRKAKPTKATKGSKAAKGKRQSTREVKKKPPPPEPKRETRQRSLGTRISPRTLERSGIAIAESSDDDSSRDAESKDEKSSKEDEDESNLDEKRVARDGRRKSARIGKLKTKEEDDDDDKEVEKSIKEEDKEDEQSVKEETGVQETTTGKTEETEEAKTEKEHNEVKSDSTDEKVEEEKQEDQDVKPEKEAEEIKEEKEDKTSTSSDAEDVKEGVKKEDEAKATPVSDIPEDPYEFELIIDSIGALKDWIAALGGEGGEETSVPVKNEVPEGEKSDEKEENPKKSIIKPVPCEVKLRKQLEALLEEKQPFAAQQLRIHEKIMKKLWHEYDAQANGAKKAKEQPVDDGIDVDTAVTYEHTLLEQLGSDNEGVGPEGDGRYPRRAARKRKIFEPETSPPSAKQAKTVPEPEPVPEGPPRLLTEGGITTRKSAADVKRYFAAIESRADKSSTKTREPPARKVKDDVPEVKSEVSPAPAPAPAVYQQDDELSFDLQESPVERVVNKRQPVPKRGLEEESEPESEEDLEGNGTLSYEDDSEDEDWGVRKRKDDRRKKGKLRETEEELKQQLQALKRQQTMLSRAGQETVTKLVNTKPPTTPLRPTSTVVTTPAVKERTLPKSAAAAVAAAVGGAVAVKDKPETEAKSVSFDINAVVQQAASNGLLPQGAVTSLQIRVDEFVLTVQVQMGLDGPQILSYTAQ